VNSTLIDEKTRCHHCNDICTNETIIFDGKNFCCNGCKTIYELFQDDQLKELYASRNKSNPHLNGKYEYLENEEIASQLLSFQSQTHNIIQIALPDIHCSACVYVLENLSDFHKAVIQTKVNFVKKSAEVHYNPETISLPELAALLSSIGYPPLFELEDSKNKKSVTGSSYSLSLKIGVAAFCFGNIMLLSFPEYLGIQGEASHGFDRFFNYINLFLSIPVLVFSGNDYLISAYKGIKNRFVNIDVPIALGIVVLFTRSAYEVIANTGSGYFDSLAGLIFFLLIGKWFQNKTYENLSFERDYKSYFPLAVLRIENGKEVSVPIQQLKIGDEIVIRNSEIIPTDALLLSKQALIDYSFVTGEERSIEKKRNELLYAGGKQVGGRIHLRVLKETSQSYLTSLWNNETFEKTKDSTSLIDKISKYFTIIILTIAFVAAAVWFVVEPSQTWLVFTAVLIVACPCALALATPFTNGNTIRIFGRNKFYLKNAAVAEYLNSTDTIVFDKTGTITQSDIGEVTYNGSKLTSEQTKVLKAMVSNSTHPLSNKINMYLGEIELAEISNFREIPGKGTSCRYKAHEFKLGAVDLVIHDSKEMKSGQVGFSMDEKTLGEFSINSVYRSGLEGLMQNIAKKYSIHLLSGDNDREMDKLKTMLPGINEMRFKQRPQDKLDFIEQLQNDGHNVMMIGDGLNDAGALSQSNLGIAVTENVSHFSPACDAIIDGKVLSRLDEFLNYAKGARTIIILSFVISFVYNIVGLTFAVSGLLTPIFAAILMPLSSITVVGFTLISGNLLAKKLKL
jgi:P-type Cu+ transporter